MKQVIVALALLGLTLGIPVDSNDFETTTELLESTTPEDLYTKNVPLEDITTTIQETNTPEVLHSEDASPEESIEIEETTNQDQRTDVPSKILLKADFGPPLNRIPLIPIHKLQYENDGSGTYRYSFQTGNGIQVQEEGALKEQGKPEEAQSVRGSYSYVAPNGQTITVEYIADENGFQPRGLHLPTPHPIPEEIQKALEKNAADEARGIFDDGRYRPELHKLDDKARNISRKGNRRNKIVQKED